MTHNTANNIYPAPPVSSKRPRVTIPSHPQGNIPQTTVPSPHPQLLDKRRATKQEMHTRGHVNHKISRKLPAGMHVQVY